jgi:hypothetical protein
LLPLAYFCPEILHPIQLGIKHDRCRNRETLGGSKKGKHASPGEPSNSKGCKPSHEVPTDLPVVSSPACKNISLKVSGKSLAIFRPSRLRRGALAIVTNVGRDAMDALVP